MTIQVKEHRLATDDRVDERRYSSASSNGRQMSDGRQTSGASLQGIDMVGGILAAIMTLGPLAATAIFSQ